MLYKNLLKRILMRVIIYENNHEIL